MHKTKSSASGRPAQMKPRANPVIRIGLVCAASEILTYCDHMVPAHRIELWTY